VQRPTHTHGRGRDGIARDPRRCRPRAIQRARLVRRCCRARPFDLGNRLDARGGGGTRRDMGIVLDGRPVLAAFQRMPSRASRSLLRAGAQGKDGLFRCAARTTARLPGGGEKKRYVVATCEQESAGHLVWRVASWVTITTKTRTNGHAHFRYRNRIGQSR
jgi:hypothetical protein